MDLQQHLLRQMAFSHATFGPGRRTAGVVDHIRKELEEIAASDGDPAEWVDVVILALDGLTRELAFAQPPVGRCRHPERVATLACGMILDKQARNEAREWPDWRSQPTDRAIQHVGTASDPKGGADTGIERIAAERRRQIEVEGFGPEHDSGNLDGEMIRAAICYAMRTDLGPKDYPHGLDLWPWAAEWWKPSDDPVRNLEKAGALIAAEIDRLLRAQEADNE